MKTRMQTDVWIYRIVIVLGVIAVISIAGEIVLTLMGWPMPEILFALGAVAVAGLIRLLISPLNRGCVTELDNYL
jgi:hypothetical protein